MNTTHVICIYHADCADGMASAYIVKEKFPEALLLPMKYGDQINWDLMGKNTVVYIVDFSFPAEIVQQLCRQARYVTILDHHPTWARELTGLAKLTANLTFVYSIEQSGCHLTWNYLFSMKPMPYWIRALGNRDLWNLENPETNYIHAYVTSRVLTLEWLRELDAKMPMYVIDTGKQFWKAKEATWKKRIEDDSYMEKWETYWVPHINVHPSEGHSDILHLMADQEEFAVGWYRSYRTLVYSFRSRKEQPQSIDVCELVKPLGGGGHKHAAGLRVEAIK